MRETRTEVPGVVTLFLSEKKGMVPEFVPGQFINVYFPKLNTPEGKAYSISSAPHEPLFSITVRAIGEFSHRLCAARPGDAITGSLPYGFFYPEREESSVVMLAGGIGITPFRSMIHHAAHHSPKRRLMLFHSSRSLSDSMFGKEFANLHNELPNFSITRFITREAASHPHVPRRMRAEDILPLIPDTTHTEFLICGSIPFTRDMWRNLRNAGISEDAMYTEAFFSH